MHAWKHTDNVWSYAQSGAAKIYNDYNLFMLFFFYRTALENNVCYYILLLGRIFCAYDALFTFKIEHSILYIIYHVLARVDPSSTITKLSHKMENVNGFVEFIRSWHTHTHTRIAFVWRGPKTPQCSETMSTSNSTIMKKLSRPMEIVCFPPFSPRFRTGSEWENYR